jgi:signal transduction histidine kinase
VGGLVAVRRSAGRERGARAHTAELERRLDDKQQELTKHFQRLNKLAVVRMVSAERERIMREMHDGLGGSLVSTLAMIESGDYDQAALSEAIRAALDDMRLVIDSLDPDVDDIPTLLAMVRCRLEPRLRRRGLRFAWQVDDLPPLEGMGPEQYLHILRIVQESITNVIKHTDATTLFVRTKVVRTKVVRTKAEAGHAIIEIEDDGGGFDAGAQAAGRGLRNMQRRAEELGGTVTVQPAGAGTLVALRIPLDSAASKTRSLRYQTITGLGR